MFAIALLSLALSPAHAASNELNFELGSFGAHDPNWELFSSDERVSTWGFRGGLAVNGFTTVLLGWQHSADGGTNGDAYSYDDAEAGTSYTWGLAMTTNQIAAGPKFDLEVFPWLRPYATVQAIAWLSTVRMDDDTSDEENINEIARTGIAPGGIAALGVDLIPMRADRKVRPATYLEAGYGLAAPVKVGDLGKIQFDGFYLHWGVGARF